MIVKEYFFDSIANKNLVKIYSDNGFFIQSNGLVYKEKILDDESKAQEYVETSVAIPEPIATQNFVYSTLIGEYQNISEAQITEAKPILLKALKSLSDEEAYKVKFFFEDWKENANYEIGDRVIYENELYNIIKIPNNTMSPASNKECFIKTARPLDYVEEWIDGKIYNIGDQIKVGNHFYTSTLDNNTWSPIEFPAGWQLIEE